MFFTHQHLRVALWASFVLAVSGRGGYGGGGGDNRRRTPCFREEHCTDSCCSQCNHLNCGRRRRVTCAGLSSYNAASKVTSKHCIRTSGTSYYSSKQAAGDACNANTACYGISLVLMPPSTWSGSNGICHPGCYGSWINNGQCDYSCNVAPCNFDGGDCPPPWPYGSWYQCKAESTWQTSGSESCIYKKTGVPSCESQTTGCEWLQQESRCVTTNSEDTTVPVWVVVLLILLGPKVCLPLFCCLLKKCLDAPDETTEQIRMEDLEQPRAEAAASSAPPIATVTPIPPPGPRDTAADWAPDIAEMDIETVRNELEREDLDEGMANKLLARIADLQAEPKVAPGVVDEPTEESTRCVPMGSEEALKAYVASVVAEAFEMSDAQLDFEIRKASEAGDGNRVTGLKAVKSMRENNTHVAPADAKAKTDEEFVREWMMNMSEEKKSMVLSGCNWSKMSGTQRKKRLEDQSSRDTVRSINRDS